MLSLVSAAAPVIRPVAASTDEQPVGSSCGARNGDLLDPVTRARSPLTAQLCFARETAQEH